MENVTLVHLTFCKEQKKNQVVYRNTHIDAILWSDTGSVFDKNSNE